MIYYAAYIVLAFSGLQLLVAFVNWVFAEKLHETDNCSSDKTISVLIPARNEENNIANLLADLSRSKDGITEIVVFDDNSDDNTAQIVRTFSTNDSRIRLIQSIVLPEGWLGKNNACHKLALQAKGDYLLFLDADVRIKNTLPNALLCYALKYKTDLLSIFPVQQMQTLPEKITVPLMHFILLILLPLPLVLRSKFASLSAANGQCMFFEAVAYQKLLPHKTFKKSRAEDIEIARYYKRNHKKTSCLTGTKQVQCRMYSSLNQSIEGFSKNVSFFFGNSNSIAFIFWAITTLGFLPIAVLGNWPMLFLYICIVVLTRIFVSLAAKQNVLHNILLLFPQQIALGAIVYKSIMNKKKNQFHWKGRSI